MRVLLVALVILALLSGIGRRTRSRLISRLRRVWWLLPRTPDDCPHCRLAAGPLERSDTPDRSLCRHGRTCTPAMAPG